METGKKEKPKRGVERGGRGEESISVRLYRNFESGGSWCQCSCSPGDRVRGWLPGHEGFLNGGRALSRHAGAFKFTIHPLRVLVISPPLVVTNPSGLFLHL